MKLPDLINLSLTLILASYSKGQNWNITLQKHFNATSGENLVIQCSFEYPKQFHTPNVKVYWKNFQQSSFDTGDQDKNAFVYHPNETFVLEKYRGKTSLTGNIANGNCSLMIKNITENEPSIYVRVVAKGDQYSFKLYNVSISLPGVPQVTLDPATLETSTMLITPMDSTTKHIAIFVPVAVLLIIIFVIGIVFCIKHKRSKSFTRQDSGYYANFRRPSSNQANSEAYCIKQDKKLPEPKAIDEPVYINMEAPPDQMDQSMDHTDSVYANVDYSKK